MNFRINMRDMFITLLFIVTFICFTTQTKVSPKLSRIWGPGLKPDEITMPARYFFIEALDNNLTSVKSAAQFDFQVTVEGETKNQRPCRIWSNVLDRKDGSFIARYKVYETCTNLVISVKYRDENVAESPYVIRNRVQPEDCSCPYENLEVMLSKWECGEVAEQLQTDLKQFPSVNWDAIRKKVIKAYDNPGAISLCHYVIKNSLIYNKCYGKYVGFQMFINSMLSSLSRKAFLPDMEFFVNLGDWPLVNTAQGEKFPIFSWCGSTDSYDIVMPTYDISESSLENMGKVTLDMLSAQGNVKENWNGRIPKLFWRGRDSNKHRLKLVDIARRNPDLFNVSLTNFFFFRDLEEQYGPKTDHVSFFSFFDYKYQLSVDGTVAAYRLPYLLAGGSLLFKQESKYYEHFYNQLVPYVHYVPVKIDLSDLVEKIKWAINNDNKAEEISRNGKKYANAHLLPKNIFCYYAHLLHDFSKKIKSSIEVLEGMEKIEESKNIRECDCHKNSINDEL